MSTHTLVFRQEEASLVYTRHIVKDADADNLPCIHAFVYNVPCIHAFVYTRHSVGICILTLCAVPAVSLVQVIPALQQAFGQIAMNRSIWDTYDDALLLEEVKVCMSLRLLVWCEASSIVGACVSGCQSSMVGGCVGGCQD